MSDSANISSLDAVKQFASAVLRFQSEARVCLAAFETQLNRIMFWLERERPEFWKREIENCMREASDARVRLHQCRMRRIGDFRPSCIEEVKDVEKSKRDLHFAQKQIPTVKRWRIEALHEANEFHGRSAQLVQILEREIPRLLRLLNKSIERIETYAETRNAGGRQGGSRLSQLAAKMSSELSEAVSESDNTETTTSDSTEATTSDVDSVTSQPDQETPDETQ